VLTPKPPIAGVEDRAIGIFPVTISFQSKRICLFQISAIFCLFLFIFVLFFVFLYVFLFFYCSKFVIFCVGLISDPHGSLRTL
jgi:hypothetical protein